MTKRAWIVGTVALAVLLGGLGGVVAWRLLPNPPEPAPATPVGLSAAGAPDSLAIGVIVSLTSNPGEGDDWKYAAEGARVAAQRFAMTGVQVQLHTVDDKGSPDGARRAVDDLVGRGVSAVIVATSGPHVRGAVDAGRAAGVPMLLPYESDPGLLGEMVWSTGPIDPVIGAQLNNSLTANRLSKPLLIDAGGGQPAKIIPARTINYTPGAETAPLIKEIRKQGAKPGWFDSIMISGAAEPQGMVVQAIQSARVGLPIVLTPEATSPAFPAALAEAGGSLSTGLATVGPDSGDAVALQSGEAGRAMSSYLAAVRILAADPKATSLIGDQEFSAVAPAADARSHDAVVAITRAATRAGSAQPASVAAALPALELGYVDGLAGARLDFATPEAQPADTVITLRSSDQNLGLRPGDADSAAQLVWFAAPTS